MDVLNKHVITSYHASWIKYNKYRWVYDNKSLLDMQKVSWDPYPGDDTMAIDMFNYGGINDEPCSKVYAHGISGDKLRTYVGIYKGNIKWMRHNTDNDNINGDIHLRISALLISDFSKFSGIIAIDSIGNYMTSINLYVTEEEYQSISVYIPGIVKHANRVYCNRAWGN